MFPVPYLNFKKKETFLYFRKMERSPYPATCYLTYGAVMVVASNVTAVCANALPFITALVFSTIAV